MQPFLALITPIGDAPAQPPLGIWGPGDPRPTNPIAGFNPGTGTWPTPPQPQPPLGIWGPGDPRPTNPIAGFNPGTGTFPPGVGPPIIPVDPDYSPPWAQVPEPTPPTDPAVITWKSAWTQDQGWVTIGIVKPQGPVPTPS